MEVRSTPRQMAKELLNGVAPARALFLPILFSLGARVENATLDTFLGSPTKISNALRQMRGHLRTDGVYCYFDPYLEVEALGATVDRRADNPSSTILWTRAAKSGELPLGLRTVEEAVQGGRVPVAVEVIRRMNALANRDFLLIAGVTGPITLGARITGVEQKKDLRAEDISVEALGFSASMVTELATRLVEAGTDLIVIQEERLPAFSTDSCEAWANLLAPTINVIRFYEALPVLHLADANCDPENWDLILQKEWECVVCLPMEAAASRKQQGSWKKNDALLGLALPSDAFRSEKSESENRLGTFRSVISEFRPAVIVTAGDIPDTTDMKCLIRVLGEVSRAF